MIKWDSVIIEDMLIKTGGYSEESISLWKRFSAGALDKRADHVLVKFSGHDFGFVLRLINYMNSAFF
ncbi:hypothetical protein ES705_50370 [subsurface metagenome]